MGAAYQAKFVRTGSMAPVVHVLGALTALQFLVWARRRPPLGCAPPPGAPGARTLSNAHHALAVAGYAAVVIS